MKDWSARSVALLCTVACATVAVVTVRPNDRHVRKGDQAELTEVAFDSNFDGRPDIQEYYDHGTLIRRELDRNFDDQVDLVEEFDAATHELVRSVVDSDYDGTADLLVLFRDGRPVFSKRVPSPAVVSRRDSFARASERDHRRHDHRLTPLTDPFRADTSISGLHTASTFHDGVSLSTSSSLPASCIDAVSPVAPSARLVGRDVQSGALAHLFLWSPRGPPLS